MNNLGCIIVMLVNNNLTVGNVNLLNLKNNIKYLKETYILMVCWHLKIKSWNSKTAQSELKSISKAWTSKKLLRLHNMINTEFVV